MQVTKRRLSRLCSGGLLLLPLLAVLLLISSHASGQEEEGPLKITQVIVAEDGKSVQAVVSLVDSTGRPVQVPADFNAQIDGRATQLSDVGPVVGQGTGLSVLLLMDISGSMDGEPILQARSAASSFIDGLLPKDVAAIAAFAGSAPTAATFTGDHALLLNSIAALTIENGTGTALFDAMAAGLDLVTFLAPTERRAIVLLTDGRDTTDGTHTADEVLAAAGQAQLPVFAIGLGPSLETDFLEQLAAQGGGRFYRAPTPSDMAAIFDALSESLRSQFVLTIPLTAAETANRTLLVSTAVDGEVETSTFEFLAPQAATGKAGDTGGGVPPYVWLLIPAGAAAILLPLAARWRRGRRPRGKRGAVQGGQASDAPAAPVAGERAGGETALQGKLLVVDGPNAGLAVAVGTSPLEIGCGAGCDLRIGDSSGAVGGVHARVWMQSNRLMVHHLARGGETLIKGRPIEWASLEADDRMAIGPHVIAFSIETSE